MVLIIQNITENTLIYFNVASSNAITLFCFRCICIGKVLTIYLTIQQIKTRVFQDTDGIFASISKNINEKVACLY